MYLSSYLRKDTKAASLAAFRILFGVLMLISLIRFLGKGWVEELYLNPDFHFKYYGFEWVKVVGNYTYGLFALAIIACVFIIIGYKYRLAIITFFLAFTYIELLDKTTYLNHYYFISLLSFLLIFLPLSATFSLDTYFQKKSFKTVPKWTVDSIKLLLGIVYFYAGLAKLNSDWLLRAQPLKIWLSTKSGLPLVGQFMRETWFHYAMSWSGAIYDLCIPFLLLYRKTRPFAFIAVVIFHVFTRILFQIGMFPYIMIVATLIFFDNSLHEKFIKILSQILSIKFSPTIKKCYEFKFRKITLFIISLFFIIQLLLPFRYLGYPNELFWTEEGFRFSWRVMLIEKAGQCNFKIKDYDTNKTFYVDNKEFLTKFQEKQMVTQPDFILQYAHMLGEYYKSMGYSNIGVFAVDSYVTLNGRVSKPYVDTKVDLLQEKESFKSKHWILPFGYEIKGL